MKIHDARSSASTEVDVRQLWPSDVESLLLAHHPHVDEAEVIALLVESPGASCWIPSTGEFILVTPWRHRTDLVTIHTLGTFANERALVDGIKRHAHEMGIAAVIIVDMEELRRPSFYDLNGFRQAEGIVTYEHIRPRSLANSARLSRLRFIEVQIADMSLLSAVHALDNVSFPWLWWNSEKEFHTYLRFPGVEIWAGFLGDRLVAYFGITNYRGWSHLDRIATHPDHQGKGYGRESLLFAVQQMVRQGARIVSLSTQGDNTRSRTLYEDLGFSRTPNDDYTIYAAVLDERRFQGVDN